MVLDVEIKVFFFNIFESLIRILSQILFVRRLLFSLAHKSAN